MSGFGGLSVDSLDAWFSAIAKWGSSAQRYLAEIGEAGVKSFPTEWPSVLKVVGMAVEAVNPWKIIANDINLVSAFSQLEAAGDVADSLSHRITDAMRLLASEQIKSTLTRGMSRTYSESFGIFLKNVLACESAVRNSKRLAYEQAADEGGLLGAALDRSDFAKLADAHMAAAVRGGFATEIYVNALVHSGSSELLSAAKDTALGAPADTVLLAAADSAVLAEYHPAQTMCHAAIPTAPSPLLDVASFAARRRDFKFASNLLGRIDEAVPNPVDIAFPQAHQAVRYRLELLTDRRQVALYGQIAMTTTGLNYKLVERLRTIEASPIQQVESPHAAPPGILATQRLAVTTDRGKTIIHVDRVKKWAPFAGCRPRVLAYAAASEALIRTAVGDESKDWGAENVALYNKLALDDALASGEGNSESLIQAILAEFEKDYDKNIPNTIKDLKRLVSGDEFTYDSYLAKGVVFIGEEMADTLLRRELTALGVAKMPYVEFSRELRLTQLKLSLAAAQVLWRHVSDDVRLDVETLNLPAERKKANLLSGLRRSLESILRHNPLIVSPPTLKSFASQRESSRMSRKK